MEKYCSNHADTRAVTECAACAKPVCVMCQQQVREGTFCSGACVYVYRARLRAGTAETSRRPTTEVSRAPASCSNHQPQSPDVARCKVCEKGICVACAIESPEGTFCSRKCFRVLSEVMSWTDEKPGEHRVPPPAPAKPAPPPVPAAPSRETARTSRPAPPPQEFWEAPPAPAKPAPPPVPAAPSRETTRTSRPAPRPEEFWEAPPAPARTAPPPVAASPPRETARTPRPAPPPEPEPVASAPPAGPTCVNHPSIGAVAECDRCSNPVCRVCVVRRPRGSFCSTACGDQFSRAAAPRKSRLVPIALAAAVLAVAGAWAVVHFAGVFNKETPVATAAPVPEPAKPEPAKPEPAPVPKPEPPKPEIPKPPPPKPEPARHLLRVSDPWVGLEPGAWFRVKTLHGGKEIYTDTGLRERGPGYVVLVSQDRREKTEVEELRRVEIQEASSVGELKLERGGLSFDLDLVTLSGRGSELLWVIRDGPNAGAIVKKELVASSVKVLRIEPEALTVKGRRFECLRVETEEGGPTVRRWLSTEVPFAALRTERAGRSEVLVDFGSDWAKRPSFPDPSRPASP